MLAELSSPPSLNSHRPPAKHFGRVFDSESAVLVEESCCHKQNIQHFTQTCSQQINNTTQQESTQSKIDDKNVYSRLTSQEQSRGYVLGWDCKSAKSNSSCHHHASVENAVRCEELSKKKVVSRGFGGFLHAIR